MKKILLSITLVAFANFSFSQQLSRYVVASGGNYSTNGGYSNSSTIGESMVTTLTSVSNVLTQGFQQSFSNPVEPTITIINPLNGSVFSNNNNIDIDFSITDFVVAAGTGDGHIHYYVNGAMTMKYDTLPITLNGLTNGSYQIIIEQITLAGLGSLMMLLEKRKKQLASEGLFLEERKKKLPLIPRSIGIITSSSGAVLKDILHRLKDRFPSHVLLWPVTVQGDKCAFEVASAIKGFNEINEKYSVKKPEILIVARGGGSIEDLWGFNEEIVVRAADQSSIPIISAIGHETDVTLLDFVADRRAPTPSAAAEMAVPVRVELKSVLDSLDGRRIRQMSIFLERQITKIAELERLMPKIETLVSERNQYLDMIEAKLVNAIINFMNQKKLQYAKSGIESLHPRILRKDLDRKKDEINSLSERLDFSIKVILSNCRIKLLELERLRESLSYRKTLERGYAIVRDDNNHILDNFRDASVAESILVEFRDGDLNVQVKGKR